MMKWRFAGAMTYFDNDPNSAQTWKSPSVVFHLEKHKPIPASPLAGAILEATLNDKRFRLANLRHAKRRHVLAFSSNLFLGIYGAYLRGKKGVPLWNGHIKAAKRPSCVKKLVGLTSKGGQAWKKAIHC